MSQQYVERVVTGEKNYSWVDPRPDSSNVRRIANPGDSVLVTATQAKAFAHRLVDPAVAEAQAVAARAIKTAEAEVADAESNARSMDGVDLDADANASKGDEETDGDADADPDPAALPSEAKDDARTQEIRDAIANLEDDDFTPTGLPSVAALQGKLGYDVTAGERDTIWQVMQNEHSGE